MNAHRKITFRAAGVIAAGLIGLTGCATTSAGAPADAAKVDGGPATSSSAPSASATPSPKEQGPAKFGQAYTYKDGLKVLVTEVKQYTPDKDFMTGYCSTAGACPKDYTGVKATIQVTNGTGKKYDATMLSSTATMGKDGVQAEFLCAPPIKGSCSFQQAIQPGKVGTIEVSYLASKARLGDFTIVVNPGFNEDLSSSYDDSTWEGAIK